MAPRSSWKGYLKLSLVSCAVALFPVTTESAKVRFNTLNRKTGNQVKRVYIDPETGETVESEDHVKGYKVGKDSFILVEDDELDAIKLESTHTLDIDRFVPRDEIDIRYLDSPYYIAPDDKVANEAFAVIRDSMRAKKMVGIARIVLSRRERIVLLEPLGKGLMATILRYPNEVRMEDAYFEDIPDLKIPKEMSELAGHIIDTKKGKFDPSSFEDRYEDAMVALVQSKQTGHAPKSEPSEPRPSNVVNLMDALRRSVEADLSTPPRKAPSKTSAEREVAKPAKGRKPAAGKPDAAKAAPAPAPVEKAAKKPAAKAAPNPAPASAPAAAEPTAKKRAAKSR